MCMLGAYSYTAIFNRETLKFCMELPLCAHETGHFFVRFASGEGQRLSGDELRSRLKCRVRVQPLLAWIRELLTPGGAFVSP